MTGLRGVNGSQSGESSLVGGERMDEVAVVRQERNPVVYLNHFFFLTD